MTMMRAWLLVMRLLIRGSRYISDGCHEQRFLYMMTVNKQGSVLSSPANLHGSSSEQPSVPPATPKQVSSVPMTTPPVVDMQGGCHPTDCSRLTVVNMKSRDIPTDCSWANGEQLHQGGQIVPQGHEKGPVVQSEGTWDSQNVEKQFVLVQNAPEMQVPKPANGVQSKYPWLDAGRINRK